jgi:hypothetical protein
LNPILARGVPLCALVLLVLTGCGGGGSESRKPPSSAPPPPAAEPPPPSSPSIGAATVNWQPPTANVDGSTLADLAGFRIFYGTDPETLERTVDLVNPGLTSYMIEDLTAGMWYFGVKAYTSAGAESDLSKLGSKKIQ